MANHLTNQYCWEKNIGGQYLYLTRVPIYRFVAN